VKYFISIVLFVVSLNIAQTQLSVDHEKEKAELLRLHKSDREAHFKTDVDLLQESAPEEFIAVSDGKIYRTTKSDERKRFAEYFKGAKYYEWDDVEEPIVRISKDGSMAWMITRVRVRRAQKDAAGKEQEQKFIYAGIMTYEKRAGKWMRVANVSTFERPS
jgi:hypothetical protein